jgi:anti-sigma regulatory factor (Ser/Thr protein kinase)
MPGATQRIELTVRAEASSPRIVRRALGAHFATWPRLADLMLCLTEVVTNAVLHAGPPITAMAFDAHGIVRVEVADGSTLVPVRREAQETSTTGRGLHLLDALTSRWGVDVGAHGKVVWFEMSGTAS